MRKISRDHNIHRLTVKRKLIFWSKKSEQYHKKIFNLLKIAPVKYVQFDDMITTEHTKLKPLSISVVVDGKNRMLLGLQVSQIPAFGHLVQKSLRKYGYRKSNHRQKLDQLFNKISDVIHPEARLVSDEHPTYPKIVKKYFPRSFHQRHKGGRAAVVGQGEMKKKPYDPLFTINQTCAMLRDNISRLVRKTWCTTKDPAMLQHHLNVYMMYHNRNVLGFRL
jgi:IS1 family transposase